MSTMRRAFSALLGTLDVAKRCCICFRVTALRLGLTSRVARIAMLGRYATAADDLSEELIQRLEGLIVACRMQRDTHDAATAARLRSEDDVFSSAMVLEQVLSIARNY